MTMTTSRRMRILLWHVAFLIGFAAAGTTDRNIQVINESGRRVEVYWVHATTGELVIQSDPFIYNGATFALNSFVSHKFQVRELPGQKSGLCGDSVEEAKRLAAEGNPPKCRISYFTVNSNHDQTVTIKPGLIPDHQDSKSIARTEAMTTIAGCRATAKTKIEEAGEKEDELQEDFLNGVYNEFFQCVEGNVNQKMGEIEDEIDFQANLRNRMSGLVESYTCNDPHLQLHKAESSHSWIDKRSDSKAFRVEVHYEEKNYDSKKKASTIHLIKNFVSPEECEALKWKTTSTSSIQIPWETKGSAITKFGRRMMDYAYHVTKLPLREEHQENLVATKLVGGGENDGNNSPSSATTTNTENQKPSSKIEYKGNPVGTMLLYCDMPKIPESPEIEESETEDEESRSSVKSKKITNNGGAILFINAGVHLVPNVGDAIFITYGDQDDNEKFKGSFVEYRQCPVKAQGEKKTFYTQTLRL